MSYDLSDLSRLPETLNDDQWRDIQRHLTIEGHERSRASEWRHEQADRRAIEQLADTRRRNEIYDARAAFAEQRSVHQYNLWLKDRDDTIAWNQESRAAQRRQWALAEEHHRLALQQAQDNARARAHYRKLQDAYLRNPRASGVLGNARYGTRSDAQALDMLRNDGLVLGALGRDMIYYNGDRYGVTYGPIGSGKGLTLLFPNMAHLEHQSLVVTDVKSGEVAYGTARHRYHNLKHNLIFLNPEGCGGLPNTPLNPFGDFPGMPVAELVISALEAGDHLFPDADKTGDNAWVKQGCAQGSALALMHYARNDPERCNPFGVWRFWHQGKASQLKELERMAEDTETPEVPAVAAMFRELLESPNQFNAYRAEAVRFLAAFGPSSPFAKSTMTGGDEITSARWERTTIMPMLKGVTGPKGSWLALILEYLMRTLAYAPGPLKILMLLDEFGSIPRINDLDQKITTYRGIGAGMQFWIMAQSPKFIERRYGEHGRAILEQQAGFIQTWDVMDAELLGWLEKMGGYTSTKTLGISLTGSAVESGGLSVQETRRSLIQPEDVRMMRDMEQFIVLPRGPVFRARRVPWTDVHPWNKVLDDGRNVVNGPPITDFWSVHKEACHA